MGEVLTELIGVDWGTTQVRAHKIAANGTILESRESELGISAVVGGQFGAALNTLLRDWQDSEELPVLMSGMIGSRQGWREVPYTACPVTLKAISASIEPVEFGSRQAFIAGGASQIDVRGRRDIMRGEETQIFGLELAQGRHLIVIPGTHSKWVVFENGAITSFRTYMTGEIFALLRWHSILRWFISDGDLVDEHAFCDGVKDAISDRQILHTLFQVRTSGLFGDRDGYALRSYLSGLLIGTEVSGGIDFANFDSFVLIATRQLDRLYRLAFGIVGVDRIHSTDANAAAAHGQWRLWQCSRESS